MTSLLNEPLRVAELFAGVGGFRLGLEGWGPATQSATGQYQVVFSNQWEPGTRVQHASNVYVARWGREGHHNEDIFDLLGDPAKCAALVATRPDVLVGGFPCQDYSVANPGARGLGGHKGSLWWAIHGVLRQLDTAGRPIRHIVLENVDRLLNSPTRRRGADYALILASLAGLGYAVEWRVINAADYGFAQRRRRLFIVAHHRSTVVGQELSGACRQGRAHAWLTTHGVLAEAFPVEPAQAGVTTVRVGSNLLQVQADFSAAAARSPFRHAGVMVDGQVWTAPLSVARTLDCARYVGTARPLTLGDVVGATGPVPDAFYLPQVTVARWEYLKGAKREGRTKADGFSYVYSEGAVGFPDDLARPSRTVITAEGGSAPSRSTHVVRDDTGRLRRLTPDELEVLNGFPRGFTHLDGVSDVKRAFLMGNALVAGLVAAVGRSLAPRAGVEQPQSKAA